MPGISNMTIFFVATLSIYVLVDAENETAARVAAIPLLHDQYAGVRERLGRDVPINILTVRPAITDEIDLMKWHNEMCARHAGYQTGTTPVLNGLRP